MLRGFSLLDEPALQFTSISADSWYPATMPKLSQSFGSYANSKAFLQNTTCIQRSFPSCKAKQRSQEWQWGFLLSVSC